MGKKGYNKEWDSLLNANNMKWLVKRIPYEFYVLFARKLREIFGCDFLDTDYGIDGTMGWGNALLRTCEEQPQWMWIHDVEVATNWIDFDIFNYLIYRHMVRLRRKGKL